MRMLSRIAAAATLPAAAYAGMPASPASAATCASADGVSVVVDFHELGGGVRTACVPGGGGDTAASLFPAAGFPLTYVQRQPSFVCRVSGAPADDPCVNTPPVDAYWALFWSDGKSGSWTYATTGVGSLKIPEGGYVAFSWNGSSARSTPGASPSPHAAAEPTPTKAPTMAPTHGTTHGPGPAGSGSGPGNPSGSASPTADASGDATAAPTREAGKGDRKGDQPSASASVDASPTAEDSAPDDATSADAAPMSAEATDPDDSDDPGLPSWVAPVAIVVLFGAAGGAALARRRRSARP
jgi:hypothetical protein